MQFSTRFHFSFCRLCIAVWLYLYSCIALAWDFSGHRLSAEIAYQNLSQCARQQVDAQALLLSKKYPIIHHVPDMAVLPDYIKIKGNNKYNKWHYYSQKWTAPKHDKHEPGFLQRCFGVTAADLNAGHPPKKPPHALWALRQASDRFQNEKLGQIDRAFYFSFIWHIIGDMHQPMHAISRYDTVTPTGDRGGLNYQIRHEEANNLHTLWDKGIDHYGQPQRDYPFRRAQIKTIAKQLQQKYPKQHFRQALTVQEPKLWLTESFDLARTISYQTPRNKKPSQAYMQRASEVSQQQIVLSGYRTAMYVENLFADVCR